MARYADIDKLLKKQFFSLDDDGFGMMVVSVTDIISAPTVERKKGEWVNVAGGRTICNNCGEYPLYDYFGRLKLSNSCPNCGADMRGDGDGKS